MEYNRIIAITGMPGLYEMVSSKTDGAIVKNLDDNTVKFVSSRVHNFSHLESIEVYTIRENVNLLEVLKAMETSSESLPADKDGAAVKSYLQKVYPDLDFERVYTSDMKKMVKWYTILKDNEIELKSGGETGSEEETIVEATVEAPPTETTSAEPVTKKAAKKKVPTPETPYDVAAGTITVPAEEDGQKEG